MRFTRALSIIMLIMVSGCAHIMSDESGNLAVSSARFEAIKNDPREYLGKIVMLGGVIGNVTNSAEGGQIEVVQYPLTDDGFPEEAMGSAGRFLITSPTTFDLDRYAKGFSITVVGEVKAEKQLITSWGSTRVPSVSMRTVHVWQPDEEKKIPFLIPGTNRVDPYYVGHDTPLPKRPMGIKTDLW